MTTSQEYDALEVLIGVVMLYNFSAIFMVGAYATEPMHLSLPLLIASVLFLWAAVAFASPGRAHIAWNETIGRTGLGPTNTLAELREGLDND